MHRPSAHDDCMPTVLVCSAADRSLPPRACSRAPRRRVCAAAVRTQWRYLNLLHASAYCGLTSTLSLQNFLMPLIDKYALLSSGSVRDEELAALKAIRIDENGARACSMYEVRRTAVWNAHSSQRASCPVSTLWQPTHSRACISSCACVTGVGVRDCARRGQARGRRGW